MSEQPGPSQCEETKELQAQITLLDNQVKYTNFKLKFLESQNKNLMAKNESLQKLAEKNEETVQSLFTVRINESKEHNNEIGELIDQIADLKTKTKEHEPSPCAIPSFNGGTDQAMQEEDDFVHGMPQTAEMNNGSEPAETLVANNSALQSVGDGSSNPETIELKTKNSKLTAEIKKLIAKVETLQNLVKKKEEVLNSMFAIKLMESKNHHDEVDELKQMVVMHESQYKELECKYKQLEQLV